MIRKILAEMEFDTSPHLLDSNIMKAISNPIRKETVKLLAKAGKLKFTDIKNTLKIDETTKLSFHLRILKSHNLIEQDSEKVYMLSGSGKKIMESLKKMEREN